MKKRTNKILLTLWIVLVLMAAMTMTAFAADDPLTVVNNLSDFSAPASNR